MKPDFMIPRPRTARELDAIAFDYMARYADMLPLHELEQAEHKLFMYAKSYTDHVVPHAEKLHYPHDDLSEQAHRNVLRAMRRRGMIS